jgi:hypothetical protein
MFDLRYQVYVILLSIAVWQILLICFHFLSVIYYAKIRCGGVSFSRNFHICRIFYDELAKIYGEEIATFIITMGSSSTKNDKIQADSVTEIDNEDKSTNFINFHLPTVGWIGVAIGTTVALLFIYCLVRRCTPRVMMPRREPTVVPQDYDPYSPPRYDYRQRGGVRPYDCEMAAGPGYNQMFGKYDERPMENGWLGNYKPARRGPVPDTFK